MTTENSNKLGKILWDIANSLRGAMMADDFRDYMMSFLFLKYLSDNYVEFAKKELGIDYPDIKEIVKEESEIIESPLQIWYAANQEDIDLFETQMRKKIHYVIKPKYLWDNIAENARTQSDELLNILKNNLLKPLSRGCSLRST